MKQSELKSLIREEIRKVIKEAVTIDPAHKASGMYIESDTERDSIRKGIKALGSKLKKVRA